MSDDLIATARRLASAGPGRPRQSDLKRAISTAYYALFHALARQCADSIIGSRTPRSNASWAHVYRALDHGFANNASRQAAGLGFPLAILNFAAAFVDLQEERHRADYDPDASYGRAEAQTLISHAETVLAVFKRARRQDRRAFVALVLLKRR